jgi:superoxide dismutase, Cu-Zn family
MPVRTFALALALAAPLGATAAPAARAVLKDAQGKEVGSATFEEADGGVAVAVRLSGLAPGKHGFHVHAVGKCDPPDFKSAGPHFNPGKRKHGLANPDGAHAGDLPNLVVGADGKGQASAVATGAALGDGAGSLFGTDGTALVIHADPDDEKTDPAGNAGARIACGVIERVR